MIGGAAHFEHTNPGPGRGGVRQQAGAADAAPACTTCGRGLPTFEQIRVAYEKHGTCRKAAKELNCSADFVHQRLTKNGYKLNGAKFSDAERAEIKAYYRTTDQLDFDLDVLCARLKRPKTSVARVARELGLTVQGRPSRAEVRAKMREIKKAWCAEHPHPRGMLGKKHSEETKQKVSEASKRSAVKMRAEGTGVFSEENRQRSSDNMSKMRTANPDASPYSRAKGGVRPDVGPMYFRSAWEANYARYLNWLLERGEIDGWDYEPETFWFEAIKRGVRSYKPDFRITEKGQSYFVEVKGWMDDKSKTKLKRMKKYHPSVEVRLVGAKEYAAIKSSISRLIPGWE